MPPTKPQPVRAQKPGPQSIAANRQLASTILGILAARQLASGISLTVTDDVLAVIGQVGDKEWVIKKRNEDFSRYWTTLEATDAWIPPC